MVDRKGYFFERDERAYKSHAYTHADCDNELYRQTAEALNLRGTALLLDLWCGTGRELDQIMTVSPWISVTGMDPSPTLLAKLLAKPYASRLTLINCQILQMPFGAKTHDTAVTVMAMHHFTDDDRRTLYKKINDVLRPGGRYVEVDRIARDDAEEASFLKNWLPGDPENCERPITGEKIKTFLREAGFSSVEQRWQKDNRAIYVAGKEPKK